MNKVDKILEKIHKLISDIEFSKNQSERYKTLATEYPENKVFSQVVSIYDVSVSNLKRELYALSVELTSEVEK